MDPLKVYEDIFTDWDDVMFQFSVGDDQKIPEPRAVFASYSYEDYEGDAEVYWFDDAGRVWENHGGHCSCYGLEGQWEPSETSYEALKHSLTAQAGQKRGRWNGEAIEDANRMLAWLELAAAARS